MRPFRYITLALPALTSAALLLSCGGGGDPAHELLRGIASRPEDITPEEGLFVIQYEQFIDDDDFYFSLLSGGLVAEVLAASDVQPQVIYERTFEGSPGKPIRKRGYPAIIYNSVILFSSPEEARAFFEQSVSLAMEVDWVESNPAYLKDEPLEDIRTQEVSVPANLDISHPHALADDIEQVALLYASAINPVGTYLPDQGCSTLMGLCTPPAAKGIIEDYVLLLRHGALWALVRDAHYMRGITVADGAFQDTFESLIGENIAARMVEAQ